ncbi:MAG: DUF5658 family protein [Planctomycetaceae bacterium]
MSTDVKALDVQPVGFAGFRFPSPVLLSETWFYCLASGLDYLMTKHMLTGFGSAARIGQVVEVNPLARYCLESWGFDGLMAFKVGLVTLVALVCQLIARRRLDVARRLMIFATSAALLVVLYSVRLMLQHG